MGGPENGKFPLLYVVKCPYVGGWVVQKSLKTPLRNIRMAPNYLVDMVIYLKLLKGPELEIVTLNQQIYLYI